MMFKRFILLPLTVACLLLLVLIIAGCDGDLAVSGTVYEWVDAPPTAHSEVYVDQPLPDNIPLIPVESANVTVTFKSWLDKGSNLNVAHTITDVFGDFKTGGLADPAKNTYVVVINKAGYLEASAEFVSPSNKKYVSPTDNNYTHIIRAVLVKK